MYGNFTTPRGGSHFLYGNIAYKMMYEIGGAQVVGPILMGMKKQIHVVPIECSVREIVNMTTIAAVADAK